MQHQPAPWTHDVIRLLEAASKARQRMFILLSLLIINNCQSKKRNHRQDPPGSSAPASSAQLPVIKAKSSGALNGRFASACDLVADSDGVRLIRATRSGALVEHKLHRNRPHAWRGRSLHSGFTGETIVELRAAASKGRFAIITRSQTHELSSIRLFHFGRSQKSSRPPTLLAGPAHLSKQHQRRQGYIHLATAEEGYASFFVSGEEPCVPGSPRRCLQVLARHHPSQKRLRPALSLPLPCARPLVGFRRDAVFQHYAVCSHVSGRATTTLFSAQKTPAYAQVDERLHGCLPTGLASPGPSRHETSWLMGTCKDKRYAFAVNGVQVAPRPVELLHSDLGCDPDGQLLLGRLGARGNNQPLATTSSNLAAVLNMAKLGHSRSNAAAIYDGKVLFVLSTDKQRIKLSRLRCKGATVNID